MSFKPVQTRKFKQFLKNKGLKHLRSEGDHELWDYPDGKKLLRPITFIGCDKEIPAFHIRTNLVTLDMTYAEFEKELAQL